MGTNISHSYRLKPGIDRLGRRDAGPDPLVDELTFVLGQGGK